MEPPANPARPLTIGVAIPTYNREQVLVDTVEDTLRQGRRPDEILVVDQTERHHAEITGYLSKREREGAIRWIRHSPPSLPGARNRALRETRCDIVIFIDDDVRLNDGFVASHYGNYLAHPDIAAVAGRVTQRQGWLNPECPPPHAWYMDYKYMDPDSGVPSENVGAFAGGNHSVRVAEALAVGGYDERFTGSALREETDMAIRLRLAGRRIRYDPSAALYHLQEEGGGCRLKSVHDGSACRSLLYFAFKYLGTLGVDARHDIWMAFRLFVLNGRTVKRPYAVLFNGVRFLLYAAGYGALYGIPSLIRTGKA